jgi:hypothetical protein
MTPIQVTAVKVQGLLFKYCPYIKVISRGSYDDLLELTEVATLFVEFDDGVTAQTAYNFLRDISLEEFQNFPTDYFIIQCSVEFESVHWIGTIIGDPPTELCVDINLRGTIRKLVKHMKDFVAVWNSRKPKQIPS